MEPSTILAQYGLPGLIIFVLAGVIVALYRDNQALQKRLGETQEARVNDQKEYKQDIAVNLEMQGKTMDLMYQKLIDAKKGA